MEEGDIVVLQSGDKSTVEKIDKVVHNKCPKKKPYSKSRPRYAKGQVEKVWENAKEPKNYRPELPSTNRSHKYE
ncbi:GH-E family nuclease [Terrisporobacter petrolearius]|uniref:GH-E family nuclease n=1 Tax=Terrisporobacter petrolearius TaxID=1460447 RepID=UPI003CCFE359